MDKEVTMTFPDYKRFEKKFSQFYDNPACAIQQTQENRYALHLLAETKLLDNFIPVHWYSKGSHKFELDKKGETE